MCLVAELQGMRFIDVRVVAWFPGGRFHDRRPWFCVVVVAFTLVCRRRRVEESKEDEHYKGLVESFTHSHIEIGDAILHVPRNM